MTETERKQMTAWVQNWKTTGPLLDEIRREEVRKTDSVRALEILDEMFDHAVLNSRPRSSSGLVEQQEIFGRARK